MLTNQQREKKIEESSKMIAKAVVSSILITLVSFSPILFLTGQEHKLFSPLVWTKTFAMIGSALVAVFVVPVLMVLLLKGKIRSEKKTPCIKVLHIPVFSHYQVVFAMEKNNSSHFSRAGLTKHSPGDEIGS